MNLPADQLALIRSVLKKTFPEEGTQFYLFGSRVTGGWRPESDLDLMIQEDCEIPFGTLALLKEAFEESPLPFKIDVVDSHRISSDFRQKIVAVGAKLPPCAA